MKRGLILILIMCVFCGCSNGSTSIDRAIALRNNVSDGKPCKFDAVVIADYLDRTYGFEMQCETAVNGNTTFTVVQPDTISGISGTISDDGGAITFDDNVLAFEPIIDGNISPVATPWLFLKTLRGGYIKACSTDSSGLYIQIDDSYAGKPVLLEIWTDGDDLPQHVEISWDGRRILSMDVENFTIL